MKDNQSQISPQVYARAGGIAYLIIIIAGLIGEMFIRNKIIVSGDAAATAHNIAASPMLWRIGIAGDIVMHVCDAVVAMVYFILLRPVNKNLAMLAVFLGLTQTAVLVANKLNLFMPIFLLDDAGKYLSAFNTEQLQALSYLSVKTHGYGFGIGLIFFGFECLVDGYLISKSGYLPRVLGKMIQVAGLCYLINSFALILFPALLDIISPLILIPPFIGELSIALWLLIKGVDMKKWDNTVGV